MKLNSHSPADSAVVPGKRTPLVTAICPCYNHARFVEESLDSIRNQTYKNIELVIVDDCSRDDSVAVIHAWIERHNFKCTFIKHTVNQGVCKTLNDALAHAHGEYIAPTSADDVWLPDKIATQVAIMEAQHEKVGVVYSDAYQMDENGKLLTEMVIEQQRRFEKMPEGDIHEILWEGNFLPAILVRKSCYDKVGPYDETLFFDDWDMWLRISKHYHFIFSPAASTKYRIVATSMMRARAEEVRKCVGQLFLKHAQAGSLSARFRREPSLALVRILAAKYRQSPSEGRKVVWRAFRYLPTKSLRLMCLCCVLGIPYHFYVRIDALLRRITGALGWLPLDE